MLSSATSVSSKACPSLAMTLPRLSFSGPLMTAKPPFRISALVASNWVRAASDSAPLS